ncbi:hypothetical protein [Runella zeae]|uniref:hypothetical protein n=1 Tax=Runella zeae TaxID=94255 RepID=UPI0004197B50|nr:hypothetical protein [Runella zeae]
MTFTDDLSKTSLEVLEAMRKEAQSSLKHLKKNPETPITVVALYHLGKGKIFSVQSNLPHEFVAIELERILTEINFAIQNRTKKP